MMAFSGGRALSLALVFLLSADPSSAFIAPAVTTSTRASTASAQALSMVAATPSTWVTTKSEETFEEAKVRWAFVAAAVVAVVVVQTLVRALPPWSKATLHLA